MSLDRLEEIEENVYSKCTYCKYDPKSGGGGGGKTNNGGGGGGGGKRNGGAAKGAKRKSGGGGSRKGGSKGGAGTRGKGGGNSQYEQQIAGGQIPGEAGRDYPTFSLKQLEKKGFKGIQPAPADKVVKNYPKGGGGGGGGRRSGGGSRGGGSRKGGGGASKGSGGSGGSGGSCPGSLEDCMAACPAQVRVFKVCVASCGRRCSKK